ncbi:hypothetical protein KVT40_001760 [Elsinoe batatas]|uniref:Uncharacterized protein n=1 Tax=Elsinoe batatas TaxID=2601811 RepID=A0A8K0L9A4_9PEZI|nr:hypothetical protein KVT40_001760 [Elsinoe batatas]
MRVLSRRNGRVARLKIDKLNGTYLFGTVPSRCARQEMSATKQDEVVQGKVGFSYEYMEDIMSEGFDLVSGNESDYKEVHDLGKYLFKFGDGRSLTHCADKPYRKLFQRACIGLSLLPAEGRRIWRVFRAKL